MARAGFQAQIFCAGTPTAFTDTALVEVAPFDGTTFQVTDPALRALSPDHAVSAKTSAGTVIPASAFRLDYLFGVLRYTAGTLSAPPKLSGRYLPLYAVLECMSADVSSTRASLDTNFLGADATSAILAQKSGVVTLEQTRLPADMMDAAGADTSTWDDAHSNAVPKLLSVRIGTSQAFRCWGLLPGLPMTVPHDGLISGNREFHSVRRQPVGRSEDVSYGFGSST